MRSFLLFPHIHCTLDDRNVTDSLWVFGIVLLFLSEVLAVLGDVLFIT